MAAPSPATRILLVLLLASSAAAGCLAPSPGGGSPTSDAGLSASAADGPRTETTEVHVLASAALGALDLALLTHRVPISVGDATTGAVVELEWAPSTPSSDRLTLRVTDSEGSAVAEATGASPLRVAFPTGAGAARGEYWATVLPDMEAAAGAAVDQRAAAHVSTFLAVPFDPDHSALSP